MPRASAKRNDGRFVAKYGGKYFYGRTQSEARAKRDEYKRQEAAGINHALAGISVRDYAKLWVETYKAGVTANVYNTHVRILNELCKLYGDKPIKNVTTTDLQKYINGSKDMSRSSIKARCETIKGLFKKALADRIITFDPSAGLDRPKGKKGTHRAIATFERQLILATEHRLRAGVMVMLFAGLRRGEAMAIDIDRDVDFGKKTITVREAVRFEKGRAVIAPPKTEAGSRTIPMLDVLVDELRGKHGLLMPSAKGGLMSESAFDRAWECYIAALEKQLNGCQKRWYGKTREHKQVLASGGRLPEWQTVTIRPHDLRHSFCTMLYEAGVDIKTAMKWMGHSGPEMIMRIYAHLTEQKEQESLSSFTGKMNQILSGGQNGGQNAKIGDLQIVEMHRSVEI